MEYFKKTSIQKHGEDILPFVMDRLPDEVQKKAEMELKETTEN